MNGSERRIDPRLNIRVPLRVRLLNQGGAPELYLESENLSQRGMYFATNAPLQVGMPVEIILRMPKELVGRVAHDVKCTARVVHVRAGAFLGGKAGVGVHIERYEATVLEQERWAS